MNALCFLEKQKIATTPTESSLDIHLSKKNTVRLNIYPSYVILFRMKN